MRSTTPQAPNYFLKIFTEAQLAFQVARPAIDFLENSTESIPTQVTFSLFMHLKSLIKPLYQLTTMQGQLENYVVSEKIDAVKQEIMEMLMLLSGQTAQMVFNTPLSITTSIGDFSAQLDEKTSLYLNSLLNPQTAMVAPIPVTTSSTEASTTTKNQKPQEKIADITTEDITLEKLVMIPPPSVIYLGLRRTRSSK